MSNFWDEISFANHNKTASIDNSIENTSIYSLTDHARKKKRATALPAGIKVLANCNNGLVPPQSLPKHATLGEVVSVKTATGNTTELDDEVFVRWSGRSKIDRVAKEFLSLSLTRKTASYMESNPEVGFGPAVMLNPEANIFTATSLEAISMEDFKQAFSMGQGKQADLIHKSAEDLWTIGVDDNGEYDIERLFEDNGQPLKG